MDIRSHVVDVASAEFDEAVVRRSREVPVLVDFWAPWCGPCRTLGPVLEKLAAELDGAFVLAKVNSDESPDLATRYGVQGIPNVLMFRDGEVVDRFVGALPERQVRAFLRQHCPSEADRRMADAARHAEAGDVAAARADLEAALELDPDLLAAHLVLARLALLEGALDDARRHLEAIPMRAPEYEAAEHLQQAVELATDAAEVADAEACARRVEADAGDLEACFALAGHAVARGDYRRALEHYLAVAEADRQWRDQAARKAMVKVFQMVGVRDPLSDEFRDKLARVYY